MRQYREFIEDGFNMGRCEDLTGGGLRRSAGGWEGVFELRRTKEYWRGDERILGDGDFANEVLKLSEEELTQESKRQGWDLNRIVNEVCRMLSVDPDDLHKKGRAKGLICYLGYYQLGIDGKALANALIHQDFFATGTGPMVELFEDRVEITNPGVPLVSTERFLDTPPKSRNEALASLMRRFRICEERGSAIDKVVFQTEMFQLPAPLFEALEGFTRTVLFSHRPLIEMDKEDRVRACYLHACLKYVQRNFLTNTSLRDRFGIEEKNRSMASRLIRDAVEASAIVPYDPTAAPKLMKYVPWWAAPEQGHG